MSDLEKAPFKTIEGDDGYRVEFRENGDLVDATVFHNDDVVADHPHLVESQDALMERQAEHLLQEARLRADDEYAAEPPPEQVLRDTKQNLEQYGFSESHQVIRAIDDELPDEPEQS